MIWLIFAGGVFTGIVALIGLLLWLGWSMFPPEPTEG